ncbi:Tetraspanin family protein [Entamoeba marina]
MVWVSVGTYSYTTYGLKDDTTTKGLDIKGLVWTDINFISGVICGSSYLILGVTTVIFFVLAFHIIGQCLSCCCCCFSCSNCCIFFIMGILILACGLTEGLDELNGDTTQLIENEFNCCVYDNSLTSCSDSTQNDCTTEFLKPVKHQHKLVGSMMLVTCFICLIFVVTNIEGTLRMTEQRNGDYLLMD